ncbi:MAG: DUF4298 domain-containing protein [Lachnospiraceae bacterium]|nr:DUF4298 domain-containing protein [Lachnospiraceae bacterium]
MSRHIKADGKLLQAGKRYSQLKEKQKTKISDWMYEAYRKQAAEGLSDEEALQLVFDRIDQEEIWIPDYEIVHRYKSKKKRFERRLAGENVPQHIYEMESILGRALQKMDDLERKISEFEAFQTQIRRLEAYYTGPQWKEDYAMEEAGKFPEKLRRGVLSQDGIWNMLERNSEMLERLGISPEDAEDGEGGKEQV